jgi:sn-glycerol 3-phosphate transport system ATP-binding protein
VVPHADGAWPLKVDMVEMLGAERLVHGRLGAGLFTLRIASTEAVPRVGDALLLRVDPAHLHWFDAATHRRV